jgi:hypothetical protein
MTTLTRDQLNLRLRHRHHLEVRDDGVRVHLRDERVPRVFFAELVQKQLIEEVEPGQWALTAKGHRPRTLDNCNGADDPFDHL